MKYYIDSNNRKVRLYSHMITLDGKYAIGYDVYCKEHKFPLSKLKEDDEPAFVEVSIPVEFPKEFVPPEQFDKNCCMWCPFFCVDEETGYYCSHPNYKQEVACPIRKYFGK